MSKRFYCLRIVFAVLGFMGAASAEAIADTSAFIDNQGRKVTIIRESVAEQPQSVKHTSMSSTHQLTYAESPITAEVDSVQIYQYQIDKYRKSGRSKQAVGSVFAVLGGLFVAVGVSVISDETSSGIVCTAIGSISLITSLPVILIGNAQARRANKYQEKLDLYKISHFRSQVSLQATPLVDPINGRGGVLLALNF